MLAFTTFQLKLSVVWDLLETFDQSEEIISNICKNIFACLFSVYNTISLSRHEQVCLSGLRFERYFSHHRAWWWEKYLSKRSPLKHTCSRRDKLIVLLLPMFVERLQFVVFGFACWFSLWYNSKLRPDLFCISLWYCLAALNFFLVE